MNMQRDARALSSVVERPTTRPAVAWHMASVAMMLGCLAIPVARPQESAPQPVIALTAKIGDTQGPNDLIVGEPLRVVLGLHNITAELAYDDYLRALPELIAQRQLDPSPSAEPIAPFEVPVHVTVPHGPASWIGELEVQVLRLPEPSEAAVADSALWECVSTTQVLAQCGWKQSIIASPPNGDLGSDPIEAVLTLAPSLLEGCGAGTFIIRATYDTSEYVGTPLYATPCSVHAESSPVVVRHAQSAAEAARAAFAGASYWLAEGEREQALLLATAAAQADPTWNLGAAQFLSGRCSEALGDKAAALASYKAYRGILVAAGELDSASSAATPVSPIDVKISQLEATLAAESAQSGAN
jgi:hypothetical protein